MPDIKYQVNPYCLGGLTVCLCAEWTPGRVEQGYRATAGERSVFKVAFRLNILYADYI